MAATYTWDVFSSLDGFGSHRGDWGGYWGKQGPELVERRLALYATPGRMVLGAGTYREFVAMLGPDPEAGDPWVVRMRAMPATILSTTLDAAPGWPDATVEDGDALEAVARLKRDSDVPLRSHGSLSLNRALMAAGLVDVLQLTVFPVITGETGVDRILAGAADLDLELLEQRTLDGRTLELSYRPRLHASR